MDAESFQQIEAARAEELIEQARSRVSPDYPAHEDDIVGESYLKAVRILEMLRRKIPTSTNYGLPIALNTLVKPTVLLVGLTRS